MNSIFEPLADALRDEIEHFGHLLSLFRDQQETLLRPDPETVLEQALNIEQAARVACHPVQSPPFEHAPPSGQ
jgi:hypothetical protein